MICLGYSNLHFI